MGCRKRIQMLEQTNHTLRIMKTGCGQNNSGFIIRVAVNTIPQVLQGFNIFRVNGGGRSVSLRFQKGFEMRLNRLNVLIQGLPEIRNIIETHGKAQPPPSDIIAGKPMGLLIVIHLEPVFNPTQKKIRL